MIEMLKAFHFIRPEWWLALPVAALAVFALSRVQREGDQWTRLIRPELLPYLLDGKPQLHKNNRTPWLFVPLFLAIFALAGPSWQKSPQPLDRNTAALVICWDLSPSMLAQDISPSRLERSRLKIIDLLNTRKDGQTALIAYSGQAYVVTPLTEDVNTIINLLPSLSPTRLPTVGSNPEMALKEAQKLLTDGGVQRGDILFLTDGIDNSAFSTLTSQMHEAPHSLTLWGIGTPDGGPIPLPSGGFLKHNGNTVVAKLNSAEMSDFAKQNNGLYLNASTTDNDIRHLQQRFERKTNALSRSQQQLDQWFDAGQYLSLLLLPFCLLLFRRGWLLALLIALPLSSPPSAEAQPPAPNAPPASAPADTPPSALEKLWQDAWYTPNQQGAKWLEAGRAPLAAATFTHPQWRAVAEFKSQNYSAAANQFQQLGDATSLYNAGNAFTHAGQYNNAIKAYEQALEKDPQLSDASHNLAIVKQLKTLAEQQKQNNPNPDDKQQGDAKNSDSPDKNAQQDPSAGSSQASAPQNSPENTSAAASSAGANAGTSSAAAQPSNPSASSAHPQANSASAAAQDANTQGASSSAAAQGVKTPEQEAAEAAKRQAAQQQAEEQQAKLGEASSVAPQTAASSAAAVVPQTEEAQQLEQWLKRVPDDPSGYLRNKFQYQYQQRQQQPSQPQNSANNPEARW